MIITWEKKLIGSVYSDSCNTAITDFFTTSVVVQDVVEIGRNHVIHVPSSVSNTKYFCER